MINVLEPKNSWVNLISSENKDFCVVPEVSDVHAENIKDSIDLLLPSTLLSPSDDAISRILAYSKKA